MKDKIAICVGVFLLLKATAMAATEPSKLLALCAAIVAAETPPVLPGESDPAPNIAGETLGQVKRRTRYTIKELQEYFPPIQQGAALGVEPDPDRLAPSYAKDRFKAPPTGGACPRA